MITFIITNSVRFKIDKAKLFMTLCHPRHLVITYITLLNHNIAADNIYLEFAVSI